MSRPEDDISRNILSRGIFRHVSEKDRLQKVLEESILVFRHLSSDASRRDLQVSTSHNDR